MKNKKGVGTEINLLELMPVRTVDWIKDEEGKIILLKPKYKSPFLKKHLLPRMKKPNFKVNLDEIGSYLWILIDGEKNVDQIAHLFKKQFGERVEPLYDRLSKFLMNLEKNHFIKFTGFPASKE